MIWGILKQKEVGQKKEAKGTTHFICFFCEVILYA